MQSTALTLYIVLSYASLIGSQPILNNLASNTPFRNSIIPQEMTQPQNNVHNYTYTPGVGAHMVHSRLATWNTARRTCESQGAHLAIINSVAEAEAIAKLLEAAGAKWGWIGVHDFYQEDDFVTILGQSLSRTGFDLWKAGEPNDLKNNEDCLVLIASSRRMNDESCSYRCNFICELFESSYVVQLSSSTDPAPTDPTPTESMLTATSPRDGHTRTQAIKIMEPQLR